MFLIVFKSTIVYLYTKEKRHIGAFLFGTRNGNRTHNYPLGGGYYIHLTMQAF